jgi:hypothetical protein
LYDAWGIDYQIFVAQLKGARIEITDTESGNIYMTDSENYERHGVKMDFGHRIQIFLSRKYFDLKNKNQPSLL